MVNINYNRFILAQVMRGLTSLLDGSRVRKNSIRMHYVF